MISQWDEPDTVSDVLPDPEGFDAVVFAVAHREYVELDVAGWIGDARPVVLDANKVLSPTQLAVLARLGCRVWSIGRGPVKA